jgi:hypothetical protein
MSLPPLGIYEIEAEEKMVLKTRMLHWWRRSGHLHEEPTVPEIASRHHEQFQTWGKRAIAVRSTPYSRNCERGRRKVSI